MNFPNFEEWLESPYQFKVDLVVLCNLGEIQRMDDCTLYYGNFTKEPFYMKNGYRIEDYFFVKEILLMDNLRLV